MEAESEILEEAHGAAQGKSFFDGKRRPSGKWMIVSLGIVLIALLLVGVYILRLSDNTGPSSTAAMRVDPKPQDVVAGGTGTPHYNAAVTQKANDEAQKAHDSGASYAPPVIGSERDDLLRDAAAPKPPVPVKKPAKPHKEEPPPNFKAAVATEIKAITEKTDLHPQTTMTFIKPVETVPATPLATPSAPDSPVLPVRPGAVLYAVNDLKLNSDGGNAVVRVTVISGALKGSYALGQFKRDNETLSVQFTKLIDKQGVEYDFKGFAIDPEIPAANVASDVDNHYLERWGGMLAASFIEGFADATRNSGITSTNGINGGRFGGVNGSGGVGYGGFVTSTPQYSTLNKGVIALGNVGRVAGRQLMRNFNRPPTVELDAGIPIGILVVDNGSDRTQEPGLPVAVQNYVTTDVIARERAALEAQQRQAERQSTLSSPAEY